MKIIFIHLGYKKRVHVAHLLMAKAGNVKVHFGFMPKRLCFLYRFNAIFHQLAGFIQSFFIPKADVYLIESPECMPAIWFKAKKTKVIMINDGPFFPLFHTYKGLKKRYSLAIIKKIDALISTSNLMKKYAEKYIKVPNKIVYHSIDTKKFSKIRPNYSSNNICSISTARYSKGADILLDVHKIFKSKFKDSKLFVLGEEGYSKELRKCKDVINPDFTDPVKYLANSGLYINPARIEPFGINILEAMCAGIPPLVSKFCGAAEIVKKVDPWLVTSLNPKEIAEKAVKLHKDLNLKRKLGQKCKREALKYTQERTVKEFKVKFAKILKELGVKR